MCVKEPSMCSMRTHRANSALVLEARSESGTYVCIGVKKTQDVVLISLLTPIESLGSMWTDIKDEVRPGTAWEQMFRTVMAGDSEGEDETVEFAYEKSMDDQLEIEQKGCVSPRKSVRLARTELFNEDEDRLEEFSDAVNTEMEGSEGDAIADLRVRIKSLSDRVKTTETSQLVYDPGKMDQAIVCLTNKLGNRLGSVDPKSILQHIEQLSGEIQTCNEVGVTLSEEIRLCNEAGFTKHEVKVVRNLLRNHGPNLQTLVHNMAGNTGALVNGKFAPVEMFLNEWTPPDRSVIGGLLKRKIDELKRNVGVLKASGRNPTPDMGLSGFGNPLSNNWSLGMNLNNLEVSGQGML